MTVKTIEGNITASKAVLNLISVDLYEAAINFDKENLHGLARHTRNIADQIYEALESSGYYKKK